MDACPSIPVTVDVNFIPLPDATALNDGPYCPGGFINLMGSTTALGFPISYQWSGPNGYFSTDQNPTDATEEGTYTLVTLEGSCESIPVTTLVEFYTPPIPTPLDGDLFCEGSSTFLDAGPGYMNYEWSNGDFNQIAEVLTPGTYFVTVTDFNGCIGEGQAVATNHINPTTSITGVTNFCSDDFSVLDAGNGFTNYEWSDGQFGQQIVVTFPDIYTVTVTDANGCTTTADIDVQVNESPTPTITGPNTFCDGFTTTLDAGTGYDLYAWSDGTSGQSIVVSTPGTYMVTVTSSNGCTGITSVDVSQNSELSPTITGDLDFCAASAGTVLDAGSGFDSYIWSTGGSGQTIPVATAGTFSVTVSDAFGCTGENQVTVVENPLPTPILTGPENICANTTADLDAGSGFANYEWSTGDSGQTISISTFGTYTVTVTNAEGCTAEGQISVIESPALIPAITGELDFCAASAGTILDVGSGFDTYTWSTGASGQTIPVDIGGTYTVTVSDAFGCTGVDEVNVVENPLPTTTISGPLSFCTGTQATLEAGSGFTNYAWSDGTSGTSITVDATGTYTLTITNVNGCTSEAEFSIIQDPNPTPTVAGSATFCEGSNTTLDAGDGFATYNWSDGSSGQTLLVSAPGTYIVTVTDDNGCTGTAQLPVTQSASLNPQISGEPNFCEGENTTLNAGTGFSNYTWSNGDTNQNITVDEPGVYSVTVSDPSGCTGVNQINIFENELPVVDITGNNPICFGESLNLNAGSGFETYQWSENSLNQFLEVNSEGTYSVTVTNLSGCSGVGEVTVVVNQNPVPVITGLDQFCAGSSVLLDAGNGFDNYEWSDGSFNQNLEITTEGTYTVTVTDANGCQGQAEFSVSENTIIPPTINGELNFCDGENTTLDAGTNYDIYEWSDGSNDGTLEVNVTGTYSVTVTDENGCTEFASVDVNVAENPEPIIAGSSTFCIGSSATMDAGSGFTTYLWSDGSNNQILETTVPGDFEVTVTNENGCEGIATFSVTQSSELTPEISGDFSFCQGESTVLDAGAGFENYIWSDGTDGQSITTQEPGTYSVTVSDATGCTGTTDVFVTVNQLPVIDILGNEPICEGASLNLNAGDGFTNYIWSDGSLNQNLEVTESGLYSVTVTNGQGCTNIAETTVIVNTNPEPNIDGPTSFCTGNTVEISSLGFDNYLWSNGATGATIVITEGGTYDLTVTNARGCTGVTSINITENESLTPIITGDFIICAGNLATLDAGSGFDSYVWSDGSVEQTLETTITGTYAVTVSDVNGCTGETEVSVLVNEIQEPEIVGSVTFCSGNSTTLDGGGGYINYEWSNGITTQTNIITESGTYILTVTDVNGCTAIVQETVSESTSLEPNITGDLDYCDGSNTILDAGLGFTEYLWSDGSISSTIVVTEPGIYAVTVSDPSGCSGETFVEVIENNIPVVNILGAEPICEGNFLTLDAGANFVGYEWSNASLNATLDVNTSGIYSVTVTDENNCTASAEIEVIVDANPLPIINGQSAFCEGSSVTLNLNDTYATYLWSDGSEGNSLEVTVGGLYSVTVTNASGCEGIAEFPVTENENLLPEITGDFDICAGSNTILDAGFGFETYLWSDGTVNQMIEVTETGTYAVTVTDVNGCSGDTFMNVSVNENPTPQIGGSTSFCVGGSTVLDAGTDFDIYQWSNGETSQILQVTTPETYSVTVTDANGCVGENEVTVIENTSLSPIVVGDFDICAGENSLLDAGLGFNEYIWSNGSTDQTIEVSVAGTYGVTVSDINGCSGETSVDVLISENPTPIITGSTSFCVGNSTTLDAGANYVSYEWSNGEINQTIVVSTPGTYEVIVTSANGCVGMTNITVEENASLSPQISGDPTICQGGSTTLNAGIFDTYLWSDGTTSSSLEVTQEGTYSVTVSDAFGCSGETSLTVVENIPPAAEVVPNTEICNTTVGGSILDFSGLILSGDDQGVWTEVTTSGATGNFPELNFDGVASGTYIFRYSTNSAIAPCVDESYEVTVFVKDCACPSVNLNIPDPLCNAGANLDLNTLIVSGASGVWSIISTPIGSNAATLTGNLFDATGADQGTYGLQYLLDEVVPIGCDNVFFVDINVDNAITAGVANAPMDFCVNESIQIALNNEIVGADIGGVWTETSDNLSTNGAFDEGNATFNINNQVPGVYTFQYEIMGNGSCPGDAVQVTVVINDLPLAEAGSGTELNCDDVSFELNGNGSSVGANIEVTWDGPGVILDANTLTPTINTPGIFVLTVVNLTTGCSSTDVVEITQNANVPIASIAPPENLNCTINSIFLEGSSVDGSTDFEWEWNGPNNFTSNEQNPMITEPGNYNLVITDPNNDCVSSPVVVEVLENITSPNLEIILPLALDCNNPSVNLNASNSTGFGSLEFVWTNVNGDELGTTDEINVSEEGTYTLLITDTQNGCTTSENVTVESNRSIPNANAGTPQHLDCEFIEVTLNGGGSSVGDEFTYTWTDSNGNVIQTSNDPTTTVNSPGTYTLLVENEINGCSSSAEVMVTQDINKPTALIAPVEELDCTITEVTLNGSSSFGTSGTNGLNYQWQEDVSGNTISTEPMVVVQDAGYYQLRVTNLENSCKDVTFIMVEENTNTPTDALIDIIPPSCFGENDGSITISSIIGGTEPYVYCFNGSAFSAQNQFVNLEDGVYNICVQDAAGCNWDTEVEVVQPNELILDLGLDVSIKLGDSTQLHAEVNVPRGMIDTLIWSGTAELDCQDEPNCFDPWVLNLFNSTVFEATVFDTTGCFATDQVKVDVEKERLIYIPNAFSPNGDLENDIFTIYAGYGIKEINVFQIYNRWGEMVYQNSGFQPNDPSEGWDGTFRNQSLNPAVFAYFAEIEFIDGVKKLYKGDVTLLK